MAADDLKGVKVALLATDGFERSELVEPRRALDELGAQTAIVSPKTDHVRGVGKHHWGPEIAVDQGLKQADAADYDALVLPGGVINADALRTEPEAVAFVKAFHDAGKPIGVTCHAPWALIEAGAARGHKLTSSLSLKTDLENAGAQWVDEQVVVDGQLVTSRAPEDIPAFTREITRLFSQVKDRKD